MAWTDKTKNAAECVRDTNALLYELCLPGQHLGWHRLMDDALRTDDLLLTRDVCRAVVAAAVRASRRHDTEKMQGLPNDY